MIQTAFWLTRDMYERLQKEGGERGLGEEIRRRLETTFRFEPPDEFTALLIKFIERAARNLSQDAKWWTDSVSREVFEAAIRDFILDVASASHAGNGQPSETLAKLQARYGAGEKAADLGRKVARAVVVEHATEALRVHVKGDQEP